MRLLVSVRSGAEAIIAARNGADIVDAKEPSAGPLGAVAPGVLTEILRALPDDVPVGVALGDVGTRGELSGALDGIALPARAGAAFLKLGFAGVPRADAVFAILREAVLRAEALGASVSVVAASYADHAESRSPSPDAMLDVAAAAGAAGVLVDTWAKDGPGLLRHLTPGALESWVARARRGGLLTALAGSLGPDAFPTLAAVDPDVVGVRGSACRGGRGGTLDGTRVRRLRAALDRRVSAVPRSPAGEMPEAQGHIARIPP